MRDHWKAAQKARWAERIAGWDKHDLSELTFDDLGGDSSFTFGSLNNPQAYCFEFFYEGSMQGFDVLPTIYDEIHLYAQ